MSSVKRKGSKFGATKGKDIYRKYARHQGQTRSLREPWRQNESVRKNGQFRAHLIQTPLRLPSKKCPEKSSRKTPGKILQNLCNINPRHISADRLGEEIFGIPSCPCFFEFVNNYTAESSSPFCDNDVAVGCCKVAVPTQLMCREEHRTRHLAASCVKKCRLNQIQDRSALVACSTTTLFKGLNFKIFPDSYSRCINRDLRKPQDRSSIDLCVWFDFSRLTLIHGESGLHLHNCHLCR